MTKPRTHFFLKLQVGSKPVKEKDPYSKWHMKTKANVENLYTNPKKILHSLE